MFAFGSWQGTAGSQRLELTVANVGNTVYHCKELPVPRGWNSCLPNLGTREVTIAKNFRFLKVGTDCFHGNLRLPLQATGFPMFEPQVTIAKNFQFLKVGTDGSQRGNQRLPLQGTAGSQRLELLVPNLGTRGYHCKELPVPRS